MDPWAVLGVPPGSSDRAIRAAYLRLSRVRHPDMGGSDGAMQELNAAYEAALRFVAAPVSPPPPPPPPPPAENWSASRSETDPKPDQIRPKPPRRPFWKKKRYYVGAALLVATLAFSGTFEEGPPRERKDEIYKLIGRCVILVEHEINAVVPCDHPHDGWVVDVKRLPEFCPPIADDHITADNYLICLNREK